MTGQALTARRIHVECLRILDEGGVEALNARHLTRRLSCSTKTLYQLVGNRASMIRGVVAHAFEDMDLQFAPGSTWQDGLRSWSRVLRSALLARPWLGRLMSLEDRDVMVAYVTRLFDLLVEHGFPPRLARQVAGNVGHWTVSSTLLDLRAPGEWDHPERFEETLEWLVLGIERVAGPQP